MSNNLVKIISALCTSVGLSILIPGMFVVGVCNAESYYSTRKRIISEKDRTENSKKYADWPLSEKICCFGKYAAEKMYEAGRFDKAIENRRNKIGV